MTRLVWNSDQEYEFGVDRGVLYLPDSRVLSWTGLINVQESPKNSGTNSYYLNGVKRFDQQAPEDFFASVEAYMYPDEIEDKGFVFPCFSYRTKIKDRYEIHLVYNSIFSSSDKTFRTVSEDLEPVNFFWDVNSKPVALRGYAPSSHLIIAFTKDTPRFFVDVVEEILYGSDDKNPRYSSMDDWISLFEEGSVASMLIILDHGDGSWTAIGSDDVVYLTDSTSFEIDSPSAVYIDADSYTVSTF